MKTFIYLKKIIFLLVFLLALSSPQYEQSTSTPYPVRTAIADPDLLQARYEQWKTAESGDQIQFNLLQSDRHAATIAGFVRMQTRGDHLVAHVWRGDTDTPLSLWLADDTPAPGNAIAAAHAIKIGDFHRNPQGAMELRAALSRVLPKGFKIGQALVAATEDPTRVLLAGSPSLFQRLLAMEMAQRENAKAGLGELLIPVAHAAETTGFPAVFNDLVTRGEEVFFNETFSGNGRSCGTCHPVTNNFTIDIPFIQSLPNNDPLFVAEFLPALIFGAAANLDSAGNPRRFENPQLMRQFGLIVENLDGLGDPQNRFVMRSVPHNIGMAVSIDTPPLGLTPPDDRTGWSGDGAPSGLVGGVMASGRVRDFVLGAIVQHYPKTLARSFTGPNPDFRVATLQELDAVEAFLLALGRQQELNLQAGGSGELVLRNTSAEAGKVLFRDGVPGGTRTCNGCHGNAGANVASLTNPGNRNFNTGVELFLRNRLTDPAFTVLGEPRPVDGGFGTTPSGTVGSLIPQPGFVNENFGDKTFNTVSLVEAADTAPFFHNNIANTLEKAIQFYNSTEFAAENGGSIPFSSAEVTQVANFLRVINAIDNIENSSLRQANRAITALNQNPIANAVVDRILTIAMADAADAVGVLIQGNLHNSGGLSQNVVSQLNQANQRFNQAKNTSSSRTARITLINQAKANITTALALMRQ